MGPVFIFISPRSIRCLGLRSRLTVLQLSMLSVSTVRQFVDFEGF